MRRLLGAVLLFCLSVSPAQAELTSAEKNEIKKLMVGLNAFNDAFYLLGELIKDTGVAYAANTGTRATLSSAWNSHLALWDRSLNMIGYLLGKKPTGSVIDGSGIPYITLTGETNAVSQISSALGTASVLKGNYNTLAADATQSSEFRANAQAAEDLIDVYIASLNAYDRTQGTWDDPLPTGGPGGTSAYSIRDYGSLNLLDTKTQMFPDTHSASTAIMGPHGTYVQCIGLIQFAIDQLTGTGLQQLRSLWNWTINGETIYSDAEFEAIGGMLQLESQVVDNMFMYLMAIADIPMTDADCGKSAFRYQADSIQFIIDPETGVNKLFNDMAETHFDIISEATMTRPIARSFWSGGDGESPTAWTHLTMTPWRYIDGTVWQLLEFPIPRVFNLSDLRAQFSRSNSSHTPPMCPDSTNPTVTAFNLPVAGTISGMVTLQADVSDNIGVNNVKYFIGATQIGLTSTVAPWSVVWDSRETSNGAKTIIARAFDAAGNVSADATVSVTVSN